MRVFSQPLRTTVALLFGWLVAGATSCADDLRISPVPGQGAQLRLQGVANKDYVIQTRTDLASGDWWALSTGATDTTGSFQTVDQRAGLTASFYRAALLPPLATTTSTAATVVGTTITVTLAGTDPENPGGALTAVITALPTSGGLQQFDGTPITAVGTVVTDPANRVRYVASGGGASASPTASFDYLLQRTSNGVTSAPQTVDVHLKPNWVFSSFQDGSSPPLELEYSDDGISWFDAGEPYAAPAGNTVRDTSITFLNGMYYIAYTAGSFGGVPYVQIARSPDLVNWTYLCNVDTSFTNDGYFSWAPEWFIDQDGTVYLFVSRETSDYSWRVYWTKALSNDLTAWAPVQRIGGEMADRGAIDPFVVRDGATYHLLYRNYGPGGGTDCIEMATGTSPTAFSLDKTGDWAGWGSPREGPCLVHLDGSHWRIYYSLVNTTINGSLNACRDSFDNLATWTDAIGTGLPSHGTCFALPVSTPGASSSGAVSGKQRTLETGASGSSVPARPALR